MSDSKPNVYIFHGDDEFAINQVLAEWIKAMGDPTTADLNISRLDGNALSLDDLRTALESMPFLAEKRLVIVRRPLVRLGSDSARQRFLAQLDRIPATTILVLVIADSSSRKDQWDVLKPSHWLVKWAAQSGGKAQVRPFPLPTPGEMRSWISKHVGKKQGKITPQGAIRLADYVGTDTQLVSREIEKLLTYVNFRRPIESDDVELLVAPQGEVDVFGLFDALGQRNGELAVQLMEKLLAEQEPLSVLGMVTQRFRLLLLVREVLEEGGGAGKVVSQLGNKTFRVYSEYYAQKLLEQARLFSLGQLEDIYRRLLNLDECLKTSQMDPKSAFAAFIIEAQELS